MRYIIKTILAVILLLAVSAQADNLTDFNTGVQFYNDGQYDSALVYFRTIEEQELASSELYYNLGNCLYKTDRKGLAVAYYLKALRLDPRNEDIKANLGFVRSTLRDKYEDSLQNPIWNFIKGSSLAWHERELTWAVFAVFLIIVGILIFMIFYKEKNLPLVIVLIVFIVIGLVGSSMLAINLTMNYYTPQGVITEPEVSILAGPGAISDIRFTAHEGLTFQILRQESGYYEGIFANRLKGWVEISKAFEF